MQKHLLKEVIFISEDTQLTSKPPVLLENMMMLFLAPTLMSQSRWATRIFFSSMHVCVVHICAFFEPAQVSQRGMSLLVSLHGWVLDASLLAFRSSVLCALRQLSFYANSLPPYFTMACTVLSSTYSDLSTGRKCLQSFVWHLLGSPPQPSPIRGERQRISVTSAYTGCGKRC